MIYYVEVNVTNHEGLRFCNVIVHRERRGEKAPNPCRFHTTRFDNFERAERRILRGIRLMEALSNR